jgi:hypothetical protein
MKQKDDLAASLMAADGLGASMTGEELKKMETMLAKQERKVVWERRVTKGLWIFWGLMMAGVYGSAIVNRTWFGDAELPEWGQQVAAAMIVVMIATFWLAVIQTILYFVRNRSLSTKQLQLQLSRIQLEIEGLKKRT